MGFVVKDSLIYVPLEITKENEFQDFVFNNLLNLIFMEDVLLFESKDLESDLGLTRADGYVIMPFSKKWAIIEVELSMHDPLNHVVSQLMRIDESINMDNRRRLTNYFLDVIESNLEYKAKLVLAGYDDKARRRNLVDDIVNKSSPFIVVILEKENEKIEKAISKIKSNNVSEIKIVIVEVYKRSDCIEPSCGLLYVVKKPLYRADLEYRLRMLINNLTENQKRLIKMLCKNGSWVYISTLVKSLGLKKSREIAGFRAGLTRREKNLGLSPILETEYDKYKRELKYRIKNYLLIIRKILNC